MSREAPEDAPEDCVGPASEQAGKAAPCAGCPNQQACASGENKGETEEDLEALKTNLARVKHKLLVLSGKGGVGKSTVSSYVARMVSEDEETQVGLLDIDICGPSIPRMLGLLESEVHRSGGGWQPVYLESNLGVMSIGFMLESADDAVIWRGPKKNGLIKQFLRDTHWDALDYLVIDTPPGTSDEHLSITQYLQAAGGADGAIIVTTPQEVALLDVRKQINFCRKVGVRVLGVVENMAGFVCSNCEKETLIFAPSTGGATQMCADMDVPYLGQLPIDPRLARACDEGKNFVDLHPTSPAVLALESIVKKVTEAM